MNLTSPPMANLLPCNDYRFLSWNIRGLRRRFGSLAHYVFLNKPTVICLQESFPGSTDKSPTTRTPPRLTGYRAYCHPQGAGLVTYIRSKIAHSPNIHVSPPTTTSTYFLGLTIFVNGSPVRIYNIHALSDKLQINQLPTAPPSMPTLLLGDFNTKHPHFGDPHPNINGKRISKLLLHDNTLRHICTTGPTHINGGYLDLLLTRHFPPSSLPPTADIVNTLASDHWAVYFTISIPSRSSPKPWCRRIRNIPPKLLPSLLTQLSHWFSSYIITSVDDLSTQLTAHIHKFHESHINNSPTATPPKQPPSRTWTSHPHLTQSYDSVRQAGSTYLADRTADNLLTFYGAAREHRDLADQLRHDSWVSFLQSLSTHTPIKEVWNRINCIISATQAPPPPPHPNPPLRAMELADLWAHRSNPNNLPPHIKNQLALDAPSRNQRIIIACSSDPDPLSLPITNYELQTALRKGRATSPGEDGITYDLIRHLTTIPGNPILTLMNLSLRTSTLPTSWTSSLTIPIPKPQSSDFRPISLTSCLCKVMERILLARLLYSVGPSLSKSLYGFLPGRSTQHCFAELFSSYTPTTCTAFVDLKAAFDIANKDVILDELVHLGVTGPILKWIQNYLSNRTSSVLFQGARSPPYTLNLGTPQGGVLSPFLFNVLMNRLTRLMGPLPPLTLFLSYADDICISAQCPFILQDLLDTFASVSAQCGLVVNETKTRLHTASGADVTVTLNGTRLSMNQNHKYLGVQMTPLHDPKRFVADLCSRIRNRLQLLNRITNRHNGASIPIARSFYILYIRAIIDYHALHLSLLPVDTLKPLETLQNQALRTILGCPISTRIVNMQTELHLPPILTRIRFIATSFATKNLHYQHRAPNFVASLKHTLAHINSPVPPDPTGCPGFGNLLLSLLPILYPLLDLSGLDPADIEDRLAPPPPKLFAPPWRKVPPDITYTCTPPKASTPSPLLLSLLRSSLASAVSSFPHPPDLYYTDGSASPHGASAAAFLLVREGVEISTHLSRLVNWSSSTDCEMAAIMAALSHIADEGFVRSCLIVTDSKPALAKLLSSSYTDVATQTVQQLLLDAHDASCTIKFIWIPSHVGHAHHDRADALAKTALTSPYNFPPHLPSLPTVRGALRSLNLDESTCRRSAERPSSVSIVRYDLFQTTQHRYGRHPTLTRKCDVATAWIRLGYRPLWEMQKLPTTHHKCKLCDEPSSHCLSHYLDGCALTKAFRPPGMGFKEFCDHLITHKSALEDILLLYPDFLMP